MRRGRGARRNNFFTLLRWWWFTATSGDAGLHTFLLILYNWSTFNLFVDGLPTCTALKSQKLAPTAQSCCDSVTPLSVLCNGSMQ